VPDRNHRSDGGFRVIGDVRWPDEPYGRQLHSGLDAAGLAEVFRDAGVAALYVSTTCGLELSSATVEIMPVPVGPPGPPPLRAQAEPGGSVRPGAAVGNVHELAEVLAALGRVWSPGGVPGGSPFTGLGIWARSAVVGPGSRVRVVRVEYGRAQVSIARKRLSELRTARMCS
jgi:hypothetical protein